MFYTYAAIVSKENEVIVTHSTRSEWILNCVCGSARLRRPCLLSPGEISELRGSYGYDGTDYAIYCDPRNSIRAQEKSQLMVCACVMRSGEVGDTLTWCRPHIVVCVHEF